MRRAIIAVLALAGCSPQAIKQVGPNQYLFTGSGPNAFAKTSDLCKSPRYPRISMPADFTETHWRVNVECTLDYEVVPLANNSYRIRGSGADACCVSSGGPNWAIVSHKLANSGRDYCAKTRKVMVVTDGSFDLGVGDEVVFRCEPGQEVESQIHAAKCDGCDLTSDSPEAAVAYCNMRHLVPVLKFTNSSGTGYERGTQVPFSCVKKHSGGSEPVAINGAPGTAN